MMRFAEGSPETEITPERADSLVEGMLAAMGPMSRVLLVPPDFTRFHSGAGELTVMLYERLALGAHVEILPALGTHSPMTVSQLDKMYPRIPHSAFRVHDWRSNLSHLGDVPGDFIRKVSEGRLDYSIHCEVDGLLTSGNWDRIISIGQLVPHEVIGIANQNKNILVGTGGKDIIDKTHFLGAVCNMEKIMGRAKSPVRDTLNYMADHFLKDLPITWLLTVRAKNAGGKLVTRGLFAGDDNECYLEGAKLCQQVNLDLLDKPLRRAVVYLDPAEFKSTWLGNKAIYRTRLAMADDGELIVIGPGVKEFGEDPAIDALIRKYGYHGTEHTLKCVKENDDLAGGLSAAAHLIHGSSEGRFRIVWCAGGLTKQEIEGVGYEWGEAADMARLYNIDSARDGLNQGTDGEPFFYISNPALGLWALKSHFPKSG